MPHWILVRDSNGKPTLFGPYSSEMSTQSIVDQKGLRDPEFFVLPTRDAGRATQMLKEKLTTRFGQKEGDWEKGMTKFRHPKRIVEYE